MSRLDIHIFTNRNYHDYNIISANTTYTGFLHIYILTTIMNYEKILTKYILFVTQYKAK